MSSFSKLCWQGASLATWNVPTCFLLTEKNQHLQSCDTAMQMLNLSYCLQFQERFCSFLSTLTSIFCHRCHCIVRQSIKVTESVQLIVLYRTLTNICSHTTVNFYLQMRWENVFLRLKEDFGVFSQTFWSFIVVLRCVSSQKENKDKVFSG